MKAVNLIPDDARHAGKASAVGVPGPAYAVIGLLAVAVAFVSIYVLTTNTISERKAKLANLQQQVAQQQLLAARLANYSKFAQLVRARAATVREIAATRFDWHATLSDLSKVVPADTSLQSLVGTVAPGASVNGAGGSVGGSGASTGALRGAIAAPAFELRGCTQTQDDVARLLSRLRLINGVTRVTLADSQKQEGAQGGPPLSSAGGSSSVAGGPSASAGCGGNTPSFDLVVFFGPLPQAPSTSAISAGPQQVSSTATPTGVAASPVAGGAK
jgi:Tfp pilus assembly protein PilN